MQLLMAWELKGLPVGRFLCGASKLIAKLIKQGKDLGQGVPILGPHLSWLSLGKCIKPGVFRKEHWEGPFRCHGCSDIMSLGSPVPSLDLGCERLFGGVKGEVKPHIISVDVHHVGSLVISAILQPLDLPLSDMQVWREDQDMVKGGGLLP